MHRVYVDLDDVLSQTAVAFTRLLAEIFDKRVALEEITSFDLSRSFDLTPAQLDLFMAEAHRPERLIEIEPIAGALDTLERWADLDCRIDVLTGRPPASDRVTRDWLARHRVPHRELYFVDKYTRYDDAAWDGHGKVVQLTELHGDRYDLIVEDSLETAGRLAGATSARVLLIDKPWNRDVSALPESILRRIERCADWPAVERAVGTPRALA